MCDSDSSDSCISSLLSSRTTQSSSSARLSEFKDARTDLLDVYQAIKRHLEIMMAALKDNPLIEEGIMEQLQGYQKKVQAIDSMLMRKRMKVAFFGRTSSGKSAVINAMLHQRILPSAMGHTTSCFCEVQATDGEAVEEHVRIGAEEQHLDLDSLQDLASAQSPRSLPPHTLLHVNMPRSRCILLDHDVVLMDTPGVDVTAQMDDCIDRYCLDADVFVLVINDESTMSRVERQFFKEVPEKLSLPNLFILNNQLDMSSCQEFEMQHFVLEQHEKRSLQLLIEKLGVYEPNKVTEAKSRIYHVSALEALQLRMGTKRELKDASQHRLEEFLRFESDFPACLAQAAVRTKFEKHLVSAKEMLGQLSEQILLLRWTPDAQERSYKVQYSEYLQRKLRAGVTHMNMIFGQQIWQHLMVAARHLNAQAEQNMADLKSQIKESCDCMESNNELHLKLVDLQSKVGLLEDRLNAFQELHMRSCSPAQGERV
ncbi:GL23042 [Drosophila persimilis]|uniref:GL23042 n=1 Tax=Drosophila persimilis TaxID=7234 RepID=B4G3X0_DROPE|nr:GL23042 [Drosophila persimilis]